jgi:hypothetical protein
MTLRTAGRQGTRRQRRSPGGWGGWRGGGGWGGGRREEYGDQVPRRPGQVEEEAACVPGADSGGPAAWRGARASAGRWTVDFGRPAAAENPVGQKTRGAMEGGDQGG